MITAMSTHELLACRDFMRLWWARLAGVSASQMLLVAIGWQMYDLTGSAWDLGLVGLLQFLPALALVLVAGHVVDRHHRARIVALCVALQGMVALVLALAPFEALPQRTLLLALSVVLGAVRAFQMPAQQALVPLLVPPALLPRAMAFSSAGLQGAIIAGPALGGFAYVAGAPVVHGLCAALFGMAAALCLRIRHADPPPGQPLNLDTLLAGVRYVRQNKVVLGAISLDLFAVLLGGAVALLPIFARDILQVGPWGLGLLRGAPALCRHCRVRRGDTGLWAVHPLPAVTGGAVRHRRGRHGQRGGAPDDDPAGNAGRNARARQRGGLGVHRCVQPARRVRVRRHRGVARAGGLGGAGRRRHAAGGGAVVALVPIAGAP
jgi:MFS family permease